MVQNRALGIATVHGQPFPLPHYCGMDDLPSVTSFTQSPFLHLYCVHNCPWHARPPEVIITTAIFKPCPPFCDVPHSHYTITIRLYKLAVYSDGHKHVSDITGHNAKNVVTTRSDTTCHTHYRCYLIPRNKMLNIKLAG